MNSVTCMAPTKTFNIAGLNTAAVMIPNPVLRHKVWRALNTDEVAEPNAFAMTATQMCIRDSTGSELKPTNGSESSMISRFFRGDRTAYEKQIPINAIRNHAPSNQTLVIGAGERDHESVRKMCIRDSH